MNIARMFIIVDLPVSGPLLGLSSTNEAHLGPTTARQPLFIGSFEFFSAPALHLIVSVIEIRSGESYLRKYEVLKTHPLL